MLAGQLPTIEHLDALPYTRMVIQEALRLWSSSAEFLAWQGVIFALLVVLVVLFMPRGVMVLVAPLRR